MKQFVYCCAKLSHEVIVGFIFWVNANHIDTFDLDHEGWSMGPVGRTGDCFINVYYCPFCGKELKTDEDSTS